MTQAGYWHVPLDGSGWLNSSERAARIFGDIPNSDFRYRVAEWAEHVREGDEESWKATMENFTAAVEGRIPAYSVCTRTSDRWTDASSGFMPWAMW